MCSTADVWKEKDLKTKTTLHVSMLATSSTVTLIKNKAGISWVWGAGEGWQQYWNVLNLFSTSVMSGTAWFQGC